LATVIAAVVARSLHAADDAPEEVLKNHQLKRVGATYVLAAEADVQRKCTEVKSLALQLNRALWQEDTFERGAKDRESLIQEMLQRRIALNDEIAAVEQEMNRGAAGASIYDRNQLVAHRNQLVLAYNGLLDRIRLLQTQGDDGKLRSEIRAEVPRCRAAYIAAVQALRELVDATTKSYAELAGNDAIRKALESLSGRSRTKLSLGPSRQFLENVKLLERIEKLVVTDAVELRRTRAGVDELDVTFNGKVTRPMIFDTGAGITSIPARLAAEIGLTPSSSDPEVRCQTADGTIVVARQKTIPSMRVGRFTVNNVLCAVMPAGKGDVEPLLGQSFHRHFSYRITPGSGRLIMTKVETPEQPAVRPSGRPQKNQQKGKGSSKSKRPPGPPSTGPQPTNDTPQ
jgi:clan AA aspartic protease (TIGR02281 family)